MMFLQSDLFFFLSCQFRDLADDNPENLDVVDKFTAKQGKANDGSTPKDKGKSSKKSWQA
ncbi:hypothetical protein DPMN_140313 [Dreissena polymorpha]|uniref:Uncharacterized protein n=1 Tax=Dreissena polymorpha TaxID=45954 RepID=A0A9D4JGK2_DREPO|nr:hypothetical protein DPMN_140313 [Dreissena polymorpha]